MSAAVLTRREAEFAKNHRTVKPLAARLTEMEVRRRAAPILRAHPTLIPAGWLWRGNAKLRGETFDYAQVRTAMLFFQVFGRRRRTFNSKSWSYGLKHSAEHWGACYETYGLTSYVSNGALILAALILGYEFKQSYGSGPNCEFNIGFGRGVLLPYLSRL